MRGRGAGVAALVGILDTTISTYLLFWQASQEVEEEILRGCETIDHVDRT